MATVAPHQTGANKFGTKASRLINPHGRPAAEQQQVAPVLTALPPGFSLALHFLGYPLSCHMERQRRVRCPLTSFARRLLRLDEAHAIDGPTRRS